MLIKPASQWFTIILLGPVRTETYSSVVSLSVKVLENVLGSLSQSCVNSVGHAVAQPQMSLSAEGNLRHAKIWPHIISRCCVKLPIHVRTWPWTSSVTMFVFKPTHLYVTGRNFSVLRSSNINNETESSHYWRNVLCERKQQEKEIRQYSGYCTVTSTITCVY